MVNLVQMRASNAKIATALPPGLVAVFAGATSGVGETSLKQFAKHAVKPRIYFLGRSKESGNRIRAELQHLNPEGEYNFISVDVSSLRAVDDVCRDIKAKETSITLLFLSTGTLVRGKETEEGLHLPFAVAYYARLRLTVNLLPQLRAATGLRRVVTVFAGTKEGAITMSDLQARREVNLLSVSGRGHAASMQTLALEAVARSAPDVAFVHCYPGFVKSGLGKDMKGPVARVLMAVWEVAYLVVGPFLATPFEEAGERHLFFATSARFPGGRGSGAAGVPLPDGVEVARGTDGKSGSGVYSITNHAERAPPAVERLLEQMRKDGTAEKVWADVEGEFVRITGTASV
ncbi:hypothetical protein C8A01DRAFT_34864 [Parachaetomium inaequale]|uniref:Oxidoreductase n=1 Tax=Parachaetomium inaequale TaxID=2588326 RepID=A0AAN6PLK1_9PEZI|nr:hypothetical protein C8A01DRAFT_34864 [Parachaetomium inaequale]